MANKKVYDMVVKIDTYTDQNGDEKGRYQNIGVMLEGPNGPYLLMDKTFNPAGVAGDDRRVLISLYEERTSRPATKKENAQLKKDVAQSTQAPPFSLEDEIPF